MEISELEETQTGQNVLFSRKQNFDRTPTSSTPNLANRFVPKLRFLSHSNSPEMQTQCFLRDWGVTGDSYTPSWRSSFHRCQQVYISANGGFVSDSFCGTETMVCADFHSEPSWVMFIVYVSNISMGHTCLKIETSRISLFKKIVPGCRDGKTDSFSRAFGGDVSPSLYARDTGAGPPNRHSGSSW